MTLQEILDEGIYIDFYKINDMYFIKLYKIDDTEKKIKIQTERTFDGNKWLYIDRILDITYEKFKDFEKKYGG